jgi:hypothetical protein
MWWKIEEVPHRELEEFAHAVDWCERAAKRDVEVRAAGVFVIFVREGSTTPEYAAGREAPDGAYLVERWTRGKKGWTLYE